MVFSTDFERSGRFGIGYVIPLENTINGLEDLKDSVQRMAEAEGIGVDSKWGTIALLPNSEKLSGDEQANLSRVWREICEALNPIDNFGEFAVDDELPSISEERKLAISWPKPVDSEDAARLDSLDFLLASSNLPKHKSGERKYPSPEEIADAIVLKKSMQEDKRYFQNNRRADVGIITADDDAIERHLT